MRTDYQRFADSLIPLDNTGFDYQKTSISPYKGEFLWGLVRENRYQKTIEIGCALGISSLYICDASSQYDNPSHVCIDPVQRSVWSSIGVRNVQARGLDFFTLIEEPSELALPKLLERKEIYDFGFIDGWHTFDHTLLDFFYLNRMIRVGGMIVFDDANWPSVSKLVRYVSRYPAYRMILPSQELSLTFQDTLRQQLVRACCHGLKVIPQRLRNEIFSDRVLAGQLGGGIAPEIVALQKIADDERSWNWYASF